MLHQQQLVARLKELPTLPITVLRVLRAVSDDGASAQSQEIIIKMENIEQWASLLGGSQGGSGGLKVRTKSVRRRR